jgi:hypothetical protein
MARGRIGLTKWFAHLFGRPADALDALQTIAARYGIEVASTEQSVDETIAHAKMRAEFFEKACLLLTSELSVYPQSTLKKSQLRRIVFGSALHINKSKAGGAFSAKGNVMYLSLDQLGDLNYSRRGFHHELFHCIDYHDDHHQYQDPHWLTLNEPGFAYSEAYKNKHGAAVTRVGFMTNYAMSAVWEDKAELYAHMIVHNSAVQQFAQNDNFLRRKVERMTELLQTFSPNYDANFWVRRSQNSAAMPVPELIVATLKIWWERVGTSDIYFVNREDGITTRPVAFYSREKLMHCLSALGGDDAPELNQLFSKESVSLRLKVDRATLARFYLG